MCDSVYCVLYCNFLLLISKENFFFSDPPTYLGLAKPLYPCNYGTLYTIDRPHQCRISDFIKGRANFRLPL